MKHSLFILVLFFILGKTSIAISQTHDDKISLLLGQERFFELEREYEVLKDSIDPTLRDFTKAMLDHVRNRPDVACKSIERLIRGHQKSLDMNNALNIVSLWGVNLMKQGKHIEASELLSSMFLSDAIRLFGDPYILEKIQEINARAEILKDCPTMDIVRNFNEDCVMPLIRDANGLLKIEVTIKDDRVPFILDTGLDAPALISEDFAKKYGLQIIGDSVLTDGIVGKGYTKMGFIDSLSVGNIIYRNVWCLVNPAPDIIHKDSLVARIDAVLGRHFLDDVGEVHILPKKNTVVFPQKSSVKSESDCNMLLFSRQPFVELRSGNEQMAFHLDTGGSVLLNANYYRNHKTFIENNYRGDFISLGGFAGIKRMLTYKIPAFNLIVGSNDCILHDVRVLTEDTQMSVYGDGMLGMDFLDCFEKVILNFKEMFLRVE